MSNFQKGAKEYREGTKAARMDRENCGESYVKDQKNHGLNGCSAAYCKGYADYYRKHCIQPQPPRFDGAGRKDHLC